MTRSSKMHDPPAWTKPGARWVAWACWPMLGLCLAWMVWRIVEGDTGQALYPAFHGYRLRRPTDLQLGEPVTEGKSPLM